MATPALPFGAKQAATASTSPKRTLDFTQVGAGGPPPSHSAPRTGGVGVAVGDAVAAELLGEEPPFDLTSYRLERFAGDEIFPETLVL